VSVPVQQPGVERSSMEAILEKIEKEGWWALTTEEKAQHNKWWKRTHPRPKYPHGGNSETIMYNRVQRAKSFGITRDNIY